MPATPTQTLPSSPPPVWQIGYALLDLTAKQFGFKRRQMRLHQRVIQDLNIDSLDLIEFITNIENTFNITVDRDSAKHFFSSPQVTLQDVTCMIFHLWGTGKPATDYLRRKIRSLPVPPSIPWSQLGGIPTREELAAGPLLSTIGKPGRLRFFQRRTDGMRVARIPTDIAHLGSDRASSADEGPAHRAELSDYLIDAEPVSTTAYARFLNAVGGVPESIHLDWCDVTDRRKNCFQLERISGRWQPIAGTEQHPMVLVSWFGANAYALWANRRDWRAYRGSPDIAPDVRARSLTLAPPNPETLCSMLPSEAQWEHAAHSNKDETSTPQPWAQQHVRGSTYTAATMPMLPANAISPGHFSALAHMPGNIWQWCRDFYTPSFYSTPASRWTDPQGATPSPVRSERGGSWVGPAALATPTYRRARVPIARGRCLGFRCISALSDLPK